jgi:multiple sugar transport system permease protein
MAGVVDVQARPRARPVVARWRHTGRHAVRITVVYILLVAISVIMLIPLVWMISTALKSLDQVGIFPPEWIPNPVLWDNFGQALTFLPFALYFRNTGIITGFSILGTLISCSLVAYGFARLRARGREALFLLVLSTLMLPNQVTMIPQYVLFAKLHWIDTFLPLIVPNFLGNAFFIFLLRQFMMTIPLEMDEAARIDGAGYVRIFVRIILPLIKPALATVAIFTFVYNWNDFLYPLIYLNSEQNLTLSLALSKFTGMYGSTAWNLLMAASLVVVMPCLLLFFFAQRYFIQGIVVSGLKG